MRFPNITEFLEKVCTFPFFRNIYMEFEMLTAFLAKSKVYQKPNWIVSIVFVLLVLELGRKTPLGRKTTIFSFNSRAHLFRRSFRFFRCTFRIFSLNPVLSVTLSFFNFQILRSLHDFLHLFWIPFFRRDSKKKYSIWRLISRPFALSSSIKFRTEIIFL